MSETPEQRRARLRAIGIKGGEATKARLAADPDYYKNIAAMGGRATRALPKPKRRKEPEQGKIRRGAAGHHAPPKATAPKHPHVVPSGPVAVTSTNTAFKDLDDFMRGLAE